MSAFDFSRYLSYNSYDAVSHIALRDYADMIMRESGAVSMSTANISSGFLYIITTKVPEKLSETVRKYFSQHIVTDNDELFLGYVQTPIEMCNGSAEPTSAKQYYRFYGQNAKGSRYATISLAVPVIVSSESSQFMPSGVPYPGFVVKADSSGKPVWAKDVGFDPVGLALPGYVVKVNELGIPEWLPEGSESSLVIDTSSEKYRGYVLMITGMEGGKMACRWVNVNGLAFENPEKGDAL